MNNSSINQSLVELENHLQDLKSARNQVDSVSEKSEQLIASFSRILEVLNTVKQDLSVTGETFQSGVESSIKDLSSLLNENTLALEQLHQKHNAKLNESFKATTDELDNIHKAIQSSIQADLIASIESFKKDLHQSAESLASLNTTHEKGLNELLANSSKQVESVYYPLKATTDELRNFDLEGSMRRVVNEQRPQLETNNSLVQEVLAKLNTVHSELSQVRTLANQNADAQLKAAAKYAELIKQQDEKSKQIKQELEAVKSSNKTNLVVFVIGFCILTAVAWLSA